VLAAVLAGFAAIVGSAAFCVGAIAGTDQESLVLFHHEDHFFNSHLETIQGTWAGVDTCDFSVPPLVLPRGRAGPIERRQIAVDTRTCTTTVEIGTPLTTPASMSGGKSQPITNRANEDPGGGGGGYTTRSASYEIIWYDAVEIALDDTRANLTWKYNGSCAVFVSGSGYWWWNTGTGWNLDSGSAWRTYDGCNYEETHASGYFSNTSFCGWRVETHVQDISIRGWYTSAQSGHINGDISYSWTSCFPLHWHDQISPG